MTSKGDVTQMSELGMLKIKCEDSRAKLDLLMLTLLSPSITVYRCVNAFMPLLCSIKQSVKDT